MSKAEVRSYKNAFLRNTKTATHSINEYKTKENKRYKSNIRGRLISHNKMVQNMLKYLEIFMDLKYVNISTLRKLEHVVRSNVIEEYGFKKSPSHPPKPTLPSPNHQ